MSRPLLNSAQIEASPQTTRSEGSAEFVQPEIVFGHLRAFRHRLFLIGPSFLFFTELKPRFLISAVNSDHRKTKF
jgi:hypothetical protein